ncbi:MAG: GDSL-type esterase/lipase family protein [Actinomycetota bacterium]|nr:GDSL-type esterase/lipase family protein [Actinomycetota bacterium]
MVLTRGSRLVAATAAVAATALLLSGCGSSHHVAAPASSAPVGSSSAASGTTGSGADYYVSIGDSYAAGYQPTGPNSGTTTRNGFAYQVVTGAVAKGYHLDLVNLGCAGATTTSVLQSAGCPAQALGPGADGYPHSTQAAAAVAFLGAHRGHIALITVALGGNDVTGCAEAANATTCVESALTKIKANLGALLSQVRAAAGVGTPIVGITYPDVLLADALSKDSARQSLAQLSVVAFKSLINPTLKATYAAQGAAFADVTEATGAYGPLTATTTVAPYGTIPTPVANICRLTYMCQFQDIHPRTSGYALIAGLIVAALSAH